MPGQQVDCDAVALSDILGPIRRRWYILLIGLLLAGAAGWGTAVITPSQYTARGLVMLLPSALTTGQKGNPLLNLGGLELPARVLIAYYSSEPAQSDLEKFAPKAEVQVTMEESTRGPIIAVDVKDVTPDGAMRVLNHVTDSIPENLARIQTEVGTSKQAAIGSMPLVLDDEAKPDISQVVRLVLASVVATLALVFFVLFSVDGVILRRTNAEADRGEDPIPDLDQSAIESAMTHTQTQAEDADAASDAIAPEWDRPMSADRTLSLDASSASDGQPTGEAPATDPSTGAPDALPDQSSSLVNGNSASSKPASAPVAADQTASDAVDQKLARTSTKSAPDDAPTHA